MVPVSYTHLDVYKRQMSYDVKNVFSFIFIGYNQAFMIIVRDLQNSVNKLADQEISIFVGILVYLYVYYNYGDKKGNH